MKQSAWIFAFCLLSLTTTLAHAQRVNVYENPQNLKVLPKNITPEELSETMKGFAFALNARCENCHVGEAGQPLTTFDFPADEKPMKASARIMLKMVAAINKKYLGKLEDERREGVEVRCMTCHRGQDRPRLIQDILDTQIAENGVDAAIAKYNELRKDNYGSHTYDFSEWPINEYALAVTKNGDPTGAIKLLDMNIANFPESAWPHSYKGRIQDFSGDVAGAITSFETALELAPERAASWQRSIDMLKKKLESTEN